MMCLSCKVLLSVVQVKNPAIAIQKVREGVMIGAGAKILGNIEVGKYAKIGANSVVLQPVPEYATAAGVPARIVGKDKAAKPAFEMNQYFIDDDINLNI